MDEPEFTGSESPADIVKAVIEGSQGSLTRPSAQFSTRVRFVDC